jgi:hypothetical protein
VAVVPALSFTCTVKVAGPAAAGVPPIAPAADKDSPFGKDPVASDHEYPPVPPVAASAWLYATPTVPLGNEAVEMVNWGGATVIVSD